MNKKNIPSTDNLSRVIALLQSEQEISGFLVDLLSPTEISEFSRRFKVAQMLESNKNYKEIEKITGMSSTTIARISKCLKENTGYKNAISLLKSVTDKHHTGHRS